MLDDGRISKRTRQLEGKVPRRQEAGVKQPLKRQQAYRLDVEEQEVEIREALRLGSASEFLGNDE